jgi:uncharacterized protein (UPF0332 family)
MTIRFKRPDRRNALSMIQAAERDMQYTLTLRPTAASASTIIRNIYECFRMLGDALLVAKGIASQDHKMQIAELLKLKAATARPIQLIDNLRALRHSVNYDGYRPTAAEAKDAISLAHACFRPLLKAVNESSPG